MNALPDGILVGWYGDDFTGAAAVMEVLSFSGLPSVLFLDVPTSAQLARFPDMRGIGIAGTSRSQPPEWMQENLPGIFAYLRSLGAPISHYKICSTLDSSPEIGSVGRAIDLAQPIFESDWVPLLLAAPAIRRYQAFGHLFAGAGDGVYRLDRHPVMSRHPVTPMAESDVARHLSRQTDKPIRLLDLEMLAADPAQMPDLVHGGVITALDAITTGDLARLGRFIWENRGDGLFAVGSQGLEYALVGHWLDAGLVAPPCQPEDAAGSQQTIVVSGSVSSVTAAQIDWALANGFEAVRLDACALLSGKTRSESEIDRVLNVARKIVKAGRDPLIFSAKGPDDPAVPAFRAAAEASDCPRGQANHLIGRTLGIVLDRLLRQSGVRRVVISGGDTSGHATRQMEIFALTALAPTVPGAALFHAHSQDPQYQGLQLALKGGQMGTPDYFGWIRHGGGTAGKRRIEP